ncbi:MAG: hypothetical protein M3214_01235 [Actinomycetota bacterium]|nr:hypothetical protein [Actinomycetota bacterium]
MARSRKLLLGPSDGCPNDRLVVLAYDEGRTGTGDLYLWSPEGAELLVKGVRRAAVRAPLPPPPDPPTVATEVVA